MSLSIPPTFAKFQINPLKDKELLYFKIFFLQYYIIILQSKVTMNNNDIVIVSAYRTAIGNFNGTISGVPAHELAKVVFQKILAETKVSGSDISEVIMGQILTAGSGQNPARQASINSGIPHEVPAWLVNQVCGSGLRAVALGYQAILAGQSKIVLAGGMESMSLAPHAVHLRNGIKMGSGELVDTMVSDGLSDAFAKVAMGITAENIAEKFTITREEQDAFALSSQNKAESAINAGRFKDEIVPVKVMIKKEEKLFDQDEFPRAGLKIEDLQKLRPVFKKDGSVTAGNSSGINDGAAAVLLMTREEASKRGLKILATIKSFAHAGVDPDIMGTGPIPASTKALALAGWQVADLDLVEANEAFAAQALCVNRELGLNPEIVNVNGGAIALGHPIGASGTRVLVSLLHEMKKRGAKKGLATLCIGGGMGVAMCLENQ
jgi:acetyl-CoA C-acetyltransferase